MLDKKYNILVAEDDKYLMKAFKDKLEREGFGVNIAVDGEQAILELKKEQPDLILLDLVMPIKNGFEVLEEIKLSDEYKNIPVIILSNLGQGSDIKKGLELGAVDYLIKSDFTIHSIVEKVKEHLVKKELKSMNYESRSRK
ncbi:response regulator [Candidatus Wolfebacteria bacterium]|nr:MAG: response regulator [Candidatus Wolfebacteria bacterium]